MTDRSSSQLMSGTDLATEILAEADPDELALAAMLSTEGPRARRAATISR